MNAYLSFENTGRKIKTLARVLRLLFLILGLFTLIAGVLLIIIGEMDLDSPSGLIMLIGSLTLILIGWISSLLLYGFGVIVASHEGDTGITAPPASSASRSISSAPIFMDKPASTKSSGACPLCGYHLTPSMKSCPNCAKGRSSADRSTAETWTCPACGTSNPHHLGFCQNCNDPKPRN